MQPLIVVVSQVFFDAAIDCHHIVRKRVQIFFLEGPVEPFDMGIVIWFADADIAVLFPDL